MNVHALFNASVEHFRTRAGTVRSLSAMIAMERWFQFEMAALLDEQRNSTDAKLEIAGINAAPNRPLPTWWVTCEYARTDLWVAKHDRGYAETPSRAVNIELKAIYNNKNFDDQVAGLRWDLWGKQLPVAAVPVERWGVAIATYVRYDMASNSKYQSLSEDKHPVSPERYWERLSGALESPNPDQWSSGGVSIVSDQHLVSLDGSHYVEGLGNEVRLLLVRRRP